MRVVDAGSGMALVVRSDRSNSYFSCTFPKLPSVESVRALRMGFRNAEEDENRVASSTLYHERRTFNAVLRNLNSLHVRLTVSKTEHNESSCGGSAGDCPHAATVVDFMRTFCNKMFSS